MKKLITPTGTKVTYNYFTKDGLITIGAGVAVIVGVLIMQKKFYYDGFTDYQDLIMRQEA